MTSTTVRMAASTAAPARIHLQVHGMTCAGCEHQVERALRSTGAEDVAVSHRNGDVTCTIREGFDRATLIRAVKVAGYRAEMTEDALPPQRSIPRRLRDRLTFQGSSGAGLLAGLTSTLCCVPAAVAFALGVGGSSFLVGLGLYRPYFLVLGLLIAIVAIGWNLRRSERSCSVQQHQRNQILIPTITLGTFVLSYIAINQLLLPWLYS